MPRQYCYTSAILLTRLNICCTNLSTNPNSRRLYTARQPTTTTLPKRLNSLLLGLSCRTR